MSRIAWPALMRAGLGDLRLAPPVFWELTPAELMVMSGAEAGPGAMSRGALEALMARFPDKEDTHGGS